MEKKQEKRNIYKTIVIAEIWIIIIGVLGYFVWFWVDLLFNPVQPIAVLNVHKYPDKMVYMAGMDAELNLTGGELCAGELYRGISGFSCKLHDGSWMSPDEHKRCKHIMNMNDLEYHTNADFDVPGVYYVQFGNDNNDDHLPCAFPIVVIDPKDAVK